MRNWLTPFFLLAITLYTFSQKGRRPNILHLQKAYTAAVNKYKSGSKIADNAGDDSALLLKGEKLYQEALAEFNTILPALRDNKLDSLSLLAAYHAGVINHYFDSLQAALKNYLTAIEIKKNNPGLQDSLIFQPLLFAGSIFYKEGFYDSALYYIKKAEAVKNNYTVLLNEESRLYNLLGVMHYETGNLKQTKNYIEKALDLMQQTGNTDKTLFTNYKLNIASALIKLEEYTEAKKILTEISNTNIYIDEINEKLGYIALKEKKYTTATSYFDKTNYPAGKKLIDIFINKCLAFKGLAQKDSAAYYLARVKTENLRWNAKTNSVRSGIILRTEADIAQEANNYNAAATLYQQAIINFSNNFKDSSIFSNPGNFSGAFAYIDMFLTLLTKAEALEGLYQQTKATNYLEAALNTYKSAFSLATYIEKTYNSDEARLFLNKIKHISHNAPIETSIKLYELTQKKKYLEDAYLLDQLNKASTLSLSIFENEIKGDSKSLNELAKQIEASKTTITRLSLKAAIQIDSLGLSKTNAAIREQEIALDNLQEKIKAEPEWQLAFAKDQIPSVKSLQKDLDNKSAIISYHLSGNDILGLVITRNKINYYKTNVDSSFYQLVEQFKKTLHQVSGSQRYEGATIARHLFSLLIAPLQQHLSQTERLVIIPDDELHYLPFEALQDGSNTYLLQKYSVQYLYSTSLFHSEKNYNRGNGTLSFAPFANKGYSDDAGNNFNQLSASAAEVKELPGQLFTDQNATKQNFLTDANHYPVIHLATHASVNNEDADRSFIAFSPADSDYKLFAKEIYNLRLDSTDLVILSACETGAGQLVKGEGLMSLSRAFAYAGCRNIITSLWKAEDIATAFITTHLHQYLAKGYTKDKALQHAKLDFLKSNEINPQLKTPNFWAHLIFIGNYEQASSSSNWAWIAFVIVLFGFIYLLLAKKKAQAKYPEPD
jgi:CHAT domain-containing protein